MKTHSILIAIAILGITAGCSSNRHTLNHGEQDSTTLQMRGEVYGLSSFRHDSIFSMRVLEWDSVKYELRYDSIHRPTVTITARHATSRHTKVDNNTVFTHAFDSTATHNHTFSSTRHHAETAEERETKTALPHSVWTVVLIVAIAACTWIKLRRQ